MKSKRNVPLLLVMIASFIIFIFAAGKLIEIYLEYKKGNHTYEELMEYVQEPEADEHGKNDPDPEDESGFTFLQVDFEEIKAQNPDVAAWIQIPALSVSYPVVQGKDNSYYLHHMFDGQENKNGSIFIDYHNQPDFTDSNTIIYGHNMKNGSMFGTLDQYQEKELFRQYPCFYIYLPDGILEYRIVSCYAGKTGSVGYTYRFPKQEDFQDFLEKIISYAAYDTGTEVMDTDHIVTLSTCVNSDRNYRYLVHGKLERKDIYFSTLSVMYFPFFQTTPISWLIVGVMGIPINPGKYFIREEYRNAPP